MEFSDYQKIPAVNASSLKILSSMSPRHYRYSLDNPRTETPAMAFGTAVHLAVLEPDKFATRYVTPDHKLDRRRTDDKMWIEEQNAAGRLILDLADAEKIAAMRDSIMANDRARELLRGAVCEVTLEWLDEETGVACKGRVDILTAEDTILVDLKTARDIRPGKFMRSALDLGYHFSMAFYADGLRALGHDIQHVYLLAVETSAPHDCAVYELDDKWLELGQAQYREALIKLVNCRKTDTWPGVVPVETYLPFPAWAVPDDDEEIGVEIVDDDDNNNGGLV